MGNLFVISGSSGVGKGTLIKKLTEKYPQLKLSISFTTRKPRAGEEDGVHYFFISREKFMSLVEKGDFLEWAEFSGNLYGTNKSYVKKKCDEGNSVILEIDTQGALNVKKIMPEATLIFIAPPSFEELENRLRGRMTESEEAIEKRLKATEFERKNIDKYDFVVVNDDIERATSELEVIILKK